MSKPWPSEPEIEAALDQARKVGEWVGLQWAGAFLVNHALERFKLRDDKTAELLRDLALEIGKEGERRHPNKEAKR